MDTFLNLPPAVKALFGLLACTSILGLVAMIDPKLVVIVAVGMVVLAGALVAYHYFLKWVQGRKSKALAGQIAQHGAATPMGLSKPDAHAKLDAMKRSFETGMQKFATAGKDVYALPWYVVVGEPGAGKTEAIRHSNVGFPPGLQDEMQGVGGTINMNWWFTNRAVLLDTAGRLMFEEVAPGETHEWPEFLKLLRRNRPNCPINGLLLVIPCDSLVKDGEAEITRKAGKIAQQLDVIQRALDIRFPVFVLITKSDLLDGFREFFEDMDSESQHQMLGWSNPQPRDVAFDPALVDQHIQTVISRIRKRRLGLLKDPIPQHGASRRTDEVDALYSLPESFALAAPRLRSYLEKVFVAGPWSAKPLFLRGIYFTSAMREGAALDLVLAQAIGVPVDALPDGRAWERERAYFLRDLFTEKIFRESGLVTRASNTKTLLRGRKIALYTCGFVALAATLLFTILSYRQFEQSVGEQSKMWAYAKQNWKNGQWHPLVSPTTPGETAGKYEYNGESPVDGSTGVQNLADFHRRLREISATDIPIGFVFKPLAHFFHLEGDRKRAQRIVFESSVVKPLVEADRARMLAPAAAPAADSLTPERAAVREAEELAALIRLESNALSKSGAEAAPEGIVKPGIHYATGVEPGSIDRSYGLLSEDFLWTYKANPNGTWPPAWLPLGSGALAENKPIKTGLDRLFTDATTSLQGAESSLGTIRSLRDDLREFRVRENALNDLAKTDQRQDLDTRMRGKLKALQDIKKSIDDKLQGAQNAGLLRDYSVARGYSTLVDQSKVQSDAAFKIVHDAAANAGGGPGAKLFPEIIAALDKTHGELIARISDSFSKDEVAELGELDALLKDFGDGRRFYAVRTKQYQDASAELDKKDDTGNLIGREWSPLVKLRDDLDKLRGNSRVTQEKLTGKFDACAFFYDLALERRTAAIADGYLRQTREAFSSKFFSPLVSGPNSSGRITLDTVTSLLKNWGRDTKSENLKALPPVVAQKLKTFGDEMEKIPPIIKSDSERNAVRITVILAYSGNAGLDHWRKVVTEHGEVDVTQQGEISFGPYSLNADTVSVHFHDYPDASGAHQSASTSFRLLDAVRHGGRFPARLSDGTTIYFQTSVSGSANGSIPEMPTGPNKQEILKGLN